jgi:septation ring formation regulator
MNEVLDFLTQKEVLFVLLGLILILIGYFVYRRINKSVLINRLHQLEVDINSMRSTPLSYKLNKAVGLTRVNANVVDRVEVAQEEFAIASATFEELTTLLGNAEDDILTGDLKGGKETLEEVTAIYEECKTNVSKLDIELDNLLEDEIRLRDDINIKKDEFRDVKADYHAKHSQIEMSSAALESYIEETEVYFNSFEEWMYASEFEKAQEQFVYIQDHIFTLKKNLGMLPGLVEKIKGIAPHYIAEAERNYTETVNKGVFLQHLEVEKNIDIVKEALNEESIKVTHLNLEGVTEILDESIKRLQQLIAQIHKEDLAFDQVTGLRASTFSQQKSADEDLRELLRVLPELKERFGFTDLSEKAPLLKETNESLINKATLLEEKLTEEQLPYSTLLVELKEFDREVTVLQTEVQEANRLINSARQDEQRATNQLLKLNLLMNDIQTKIESRHLPHISNTYEGDVKKASSLIHQINVLLSQNPLNIKLLNGTLHETIDYVYKLYNNVNNLVGTVDMVENAIVYANKYRSSSQELDSELTRAEVSFRNGEYTYALKTAIYAIERLKPGTQYEELILQNAKSA